MFNLKLLFGLCLVATCILADTSEQLSSEERGRQPVPVAVRQYIYESDDIDVKDVSEEDRCAAPNGLGLRNLIRQVDRLLPKREMKNIIRSYSQDPEIIAVRAFAKSRETRRKLRVISHSQQFRAVKEYSCRVLHLDLEHYHNIASNLINPSTKQTDNTQRTGIRGLANALEAVLPKQKLRELYERLMRTDPELVKAVDHLKSDEFHQLLLSVKNLPEYQDLRRQLVNLGVPVDDMRNLIGKALGWSDDYDVLF